MPRRPHPTHAAHLIHPKQFRSGQATGMFIYGERLLQPPRVSDVRLESSYHNWNKADLDVQNAYIGLTVTVTPNRRKRRSRPRGDDDITITLIYDDTSESEPITVCGIPIDDSRWLKAQKQKAKQKTTAKKSRRATASKR